MESYCFVTFFHLSIYCEYPSMLTIDPFYLYHVWIYIIYSIHCCGYFDCLQSFTISSNTMINILINSSLPMCSIIF